MPRPCRPRRPRVPVAHNLKSKCNMPAGFTRCVKAGGRLRTIKPNGAGSRTYMHICYLNGKSYRGEVKKRKKAVAKQRYGTSHMIGPDELKKLCKGRPEVIFLGTGQYGRVELTDEGQEFLRRRAIEWRALPTPEAAHAYNECERSKAPLLHVTC